MSDTFTYTVLHAESQSGTLILVPCEQDITRFEERLTRAAAELDLSHQWVEELQSAKTPADPEHLKVARENHTLFVCRFREITTWLAWAKRTVKEFGERAERWTFVMHRPTYREWADALADAKEISADRIDMSRLIPAILEQGIESWPFEQPITREVIGGLSPGLVDTLWRELTARSHLLPMPVLVPGDSVPLGVIMPCDPVTVDFNVARRG